MILSDATKSDCALIRTTAPIVLNITNYVAMNVSANALLAIGASPLMSFFPDEMDELVAISQSACINIGCLDNQQVEAMKRAVRALKSKGKPYVLDPVGVGASHVRMAVCRELISAYPPAVIRGNASEIVALAGGSSSSCGVDSTVSSDDALLLSSAKSLALSSGSVVSVSGATDVIVAADGLATSLSGGSPLMPRITAMGCTASAITAAFVAVTTDHFRAAVDAASVMKYAASCVRGARGTASFQTSFIDELSNI